MPDKLFYSTGIPVSLWIINKSKKQEGKTVFIDARSLGTMVSRAHRELSIKDIDEISTTYHKFTTGENVENLGCSHVADLKEIEDNNFVLTPGRYVGMEEAEDDGIPFEEKMENLTSELSELLNESHRLEEEIRKQLGGIGFDV